MFDLFAEESQEPAGVPIDGDFECQSPACIEDGRPLSVEIAYWDPETNVLTWTCPNEHKSKIKDFM